MELKDEQIILLKSTKFSAQLNEMNSGSLDKKVFEIFNKHEGHFRNAFVNIMLFFYVKNEYCRLDYDGIFLHKI